MVSSAVFRQLFNFNSIAILFSHQISSSSSANRWMSQSQSLIPVMLILTTVNSSLCASMALCHEEMAASSVKSSMKLPDHAIHQEMFRNGNLIEVQHQRCSTMKKYFYLFFSSHPDCCCSAVVTSTKTVWQKKSSTILRIQQQQLQRNRKDHRDHSVSVQRHELKKTMNEDNNMETNIEQTSQ